MRNVLLSEYETMLSAIAARHGAVCGATLDRSTARWLSTAGACEVTIEFRASADMRALQPRLIVSNGHSLPSDPALALALLDDSRATIVRALLAFGEVQELIVWLDAAPCDSCGAKGSTLFGPCERCGGTGKRAEVCNG